MSETTVINRPEDKYSSNMKPTVKGNWNEQKNKLKAKFQNLNDKDLYYEQGKKDEMLVRVALKIGKSKEQLDQLIESL